ncbi:MAG: hypothetical protein ACJ749_07455 [Flavisolibacter sp.]
MNTSHLTGEVKEFLVNTRSLQVKMFIHHDLREAEKAIGLWLQHHDVNIRHLSQSQSEQGGRFVFVMSVLYQQNS